MILQTREMNDKTFFSLSDETKIKMHNNQFSVPSSELKAVWAWIGGNTKEPFYCETETSSKKNPDKWLLFYSDEDAVAFKLRWI